ncbi:MAG: hypothetical protein GY906_13750 [bacterium]|nr:hypothetical protein [bacterium]
MKKHTIVMLVAGLCLLFTGCYKHTYTIGEGATTGSKVAYEHWHHHWIFGIIGDENVNISEICPSGNATIHEERSFLNGIVDVLIGFIYSPTTVTVICAEGGETEIELTSDKIAMIVADPRFLLAVEEYAPERLADATMALQYLELNEFRLAALE